MFSLSAFALSLLTYNAVKPDFAFGAALKRSGTPPETSGVTPIPCHSHNDYLRDQPLINALQNGCIGIEADIFQGAGVNDDLLVGHTSDTLSANKTLNNLYIEPILQRLASANGGKESLSSPSAPWSGIWLEKKEQTLVFMMDFKQSGDDIWSSLMTALKPLRDGGFLSYWDINKKEYHERAVTVVVSGSSTIDQVTQQKTTTGSLTRRDVFFDAPLADLGSAGKYDKSNSYYASTDYGKDSNDDTIKQQIGEAKKQGLVSRLWDAKDNTDDYAELKGDGVGIYNTDHLTTFKTWYDSNQ